jgi:diguanylate cyclase (GGDEF)-like protein
MHPLQTTTIDWLVAVSILISIVSSYAAFSFADRMASSKGATFYFWLGSGSLAMGLGIWSMHYLGMLSVRLPIDVAYHIPTVFLSLLLAIFASATVLLVVSRAHPTTLQKNAGSLLMGAGIGGMHYIGMHAMRCAAMHEYRLSLVIVSVIVAVVFSRMAIAIAFSLRSDSAQPELMRLGGAIVMGLGIAAMHYTAMAAVTFMPSTAPYSTQDTMHINTIGILGVATVTALILIGTLVSALFDRRVYEELALERDRFLAAVDSSLDCLYICTALRDGDGEIIDFIFNFVNRNAETMFNRPVAQMIGKRLFETFPVMRELGLFDRYKQVAMTGEPMALEFPIQDKSILSGWMRVQAVKVRDGVCITASDITKRKSNEDQLVYLAQHDPLTGLLNRSLLRERIAEAMEHARIHHRFVGVFLIDLDHFKTINDTIGHAAGDCVLVAVAGRICDAVRAADSVIRIGGDEFIVIMGGIAASESIHVCADKLLTIFKEPVNSSGELIKVTGSIGGAVFPGAAETVQDLVSCADQAMYVAKMRGKNQAEILFNPSTEPETVPSPKPSPITANKSSGPSSAH